MSSVRSEIIFWAWAVAWEPMVNHMPEWVRRVTHRFSCTSSWREVRQFLVWKLHSHSSCVTNKLCWVAETQKIWQFCHFPWPLSVASPFSFSLSLVTVRYREQTLLFFLLPSYLLMFRRGWEERSFVCLWKAPDVLFWIEERN